MEGGPGAPRGSNTDRSSRWRDHRMTLGVVRGAQPNHAIVEARSRRLGPLLSADNSKATPIGRLLAVGRAIGR